MGTKRLDWVRNVRSLGTKRPEFGTKRLGTKRLGYETSGYPKEGSCEYFINNNGNEQRVLITPNEPAFELIATEEKATRYERERAIK